MKGGSSLDFDVNTRRTYRIRAQDHWIETPSTNLCGVEREMRRGSPPSWEGGGGSGEEGSGETTTFLPHLHTHQPSKHHLSSSDVITASLQQHQGSDKQTKIDNDDEKENSPLSTPLVKGLCVCSSKVNRKPSKEVVSVSQQKG